IYGLISLSWHKGLSLTQAWLSLVAFWVFMLVCSIAKERVVERWNQRPRRPAPAFCVSTGSVTCEGARPPLGSSAHQRAARRSANPPPRERHHRWHSRTTTRRCHE